MKLKVGDRVAVYACGRIVGTVKQIGVELVSVKFDDEERQYRYHPKQLRRLKPKVKREPRRVWVTIRKSDGFIFTAYDHFRTAIDKDNECIEFIEVLK